MVDRIKLLGWSLSNASLSPKQKNAINANLEKALDDALCGVSLIAAQAMTAREDLIIYLSDTAPAKTLLAIAKAWEPERAKIDAEQKSELKHDLVSLLNGKRLSYTKLTTSLANAQELQGEARADLRHTISRIAPSADLKALTKQWDPNLPKPATKRSEQVPHLLALADGEVTPHPSKKLALEHFRELNTQTNGASLSQIEAREALKAILARVKKWDRYLAPQPTTKAAALKHIDDLVSQRVAASPKPTAKR